MKNRIAGSVLTAVLFLASPVVSQIPDDRLIVSGQRVGKWTLQMSIEELAAANGQPTITEVVWPRPGLEVATFRPTTLYFWREFIAGSRDGKKVDYLYSRDSNFSTQQGLRYGSKSEEVLGAYGRPTYGPPVVPGLLQRLLIYDRAGLFFFLTLESVSSIGVFQPGMARELWVVQ